PPPAPRPGPKPVLPEQLEQPREVDRLTLAPLRLRLEARQIDHQGVVIEEIRDVAIARLELARQCIQVRRLQDQGDERQRGALDLESVWGGALNSDRHERQLLSGRSDAASPGHVRAGGGSMKPRCWLFFVTLRLRTNAQRFF